MSKNWGALKRLQKLGPPTLGETPFDTVTFLATAANADFSGVSEDR